MRSKTSKAEEVGEALGTLAGIFISALIVMLALHLLHDDVRRVPALGYWPIFWSILAIHWLCVEIGYVVVRKARREL
jgi:hypothetical protein